MLKFEIHHTNQKARRGTLHTAHGSVQTPAFMPVGTVGTVKAMMPETVRETGAEIILGNTYHLMLRPTAERVASFGGLHKFMNWSGPILTDSGGFQVMSLSGLRKITEEGVTFHSHIDGSKHFLSPERSMEIQHLLDANITMAFDECVKYPATHQVVEKSMERSMRWAKRSKEAFVDREGYGLFGIVQGGMFEDLRHKSIKSLTNIGFDGYAIGGLAVGEGQEIMFSVLDYTACALPDDKPRYLMGVGRPSDIVGAVKRGVDMFDCVMPSRSGRTGQAFTSHGVLNIRNACHIDSHDPLDAECTCPACRHYTRGYLHHLFRAGEILGSMLLTTHNIHFYQNLMKQIRLSIEENRFDEFHDSFMQRYKDDRKM
ncbi:MAG: tRNA guanosine(34) transglycosylase Tgt [Alphaproteobacteria bacterium]|nr:tRNA guanosine(34) transglycosylase Tgt [Alphaproteobacteria bacterium]MBQ8558065.1 tRNA guanosine(34) transglycosylase Tgt [Alphaproteobacteria bacterium]MBR3913059.1 tRNA guanosine(34) transglycosylase Tgt [Alphaproteobacteria bacterium]